MWILSRLSYVSEKIFIFCKMMGGGDLEYYLNFLLSMYCDLLKNCSVNRDLKCIL